MENDKSTESDQESALQERVIQLEKQASDKQAVIEYLEEDNINLVFENNELKASIVLQQDVNTESDMLQSFGDDLSPIRNSNLRKRSDHSFDHSFDDSSVQLKRPRTAHVFSEDTLTAIDENAQQFVNKSYSQMISLLEQLSAAKQKVATLENQVVETDTVNGELQEQIETEKQEHANLKTKISEEDQIIDQLLEQISVFRQSHNTFEQNFAELNACVEQDLKKSAELSAQNDELTKSFQFEKERADEAHAEIDELQETIEELEQQNAELDESLELEQRDVYERANKIEDLNQKLFWANQEVSALLFELNGTIEKHTDQVEKLNEKINTANEDISTLESALEIEQQQFHESSAMIDSLRQKLYEANEENSDLRAQFDEMDNAVSNAALKQQVETELKTLTDKYEKSLQKCRKLQKEIDDAVERRNKTFKKMNKQGLKKYAQDQYADAIELFFKLIGIEESGRKDSHWLGKLWNNVSICWFGMKQYEKAVEASDKAIGHDSSCGLFFYNRGLANSSLNNQEEAKADFEEASNIDPTDDDSKEELALLEKR